MSRIGKKIILIENGTKVEINNGVIKVTGPKGELTQYYDEKIKIVVEGDKVNVINELKQKEFRSKHGLYRSLIANMIKGVNVGFEKELELVGVGYRATQKGKNVDVTLGFSHPVTLTPIEGVEIKVMEQTRLKISGISKQAVGEVASNIRMLRKPDPYKGKGVKYIDEVIKRKQGKSVKK